MQLTPSQPYLLRAIYEWIVDNELTPYLLVDATAQDVAVPRQYIENGKIVLNIAPRAVENLELRNDHVVFDARFAGKPMQVMFPVTAALAIYAKENGQGMVFNESHNDHEPEPPNSTKPSLKIVK